VLTRTVLLGGELVDGRHDTRRVHALVLCVKDAEYGRRIVVDALTRQKRTASKGRCHDVRGARLMTLDGRLNLVVVGIVVIAFTVTMESRRFARRMMTRHARHTA
jgi:hypothetical protein